MTRKSPIRHIVHMHRRKNKTIHSYTRGTGYAVRKIAKPKLSIIPKISDKYQYILAEGKDQDANIIGYKPQSEKLVWMAPAQFLSLTPPAYYDKKSLKKIKERLKAKQPIDALWMDVDITTWQVQRHEGRHRAKTAQDLGIAKVPVVLYAKNGYEWAESKKLPGSEGVEFLHKERH